MIIDAEKSGLR
ncbi:hypothetical protein SOVF_200130, partial [Spinacia oleracea]